MSTSKKYLIFDTEVDGAIRADAEGARKGYAYHTTPNGVTRYHTYPELTNDDTYALDVTDYELTSDEESSTVSSFEPKEIPEEYR